MRPLKAVPNLQQPHHQVTSLMPLPPPRLQPLMHPATPVLAWKMWLPAHPWPLALMRVLAAHARPETPAAQTSAAAVAAAAVAGGLQTDAPVDAGTPIEASTPAERVVGAIFERAPAPAGAADFDPHSSAGSNLYANTRETLVSSNPQVAARSEVVHSTVGSPRWANEIGSRLMMMSVRGQQEGSLSLDA